MTSTAIIRAMPNPINHAGKKYHRLTVLTQVENGTYGRRWKCSCDCGNLTVVYANSLGTTKSCGCARKEQDARGGTRLTHGATRYGIKPPEWVVWCGMRDRCLNPNHKSWENYGGRGITVCPDWLHSFGSFFADMGRRPSPKHKLDRIDNNLGYNAANCKWSTDKEQANNRRPRRWKVRPRHGSPSVD